MVEMMLDQFMGLDFKETAQFCLQFLKLGSSGVRYSTVRKPKQPHGQAVCSYSSQQPFQRFQPASSYVQPELAAKCGLDRN